MACVVVLMLRVMFRSAFDGHSPAVSTAERHGSGRQGKQTYEDPGEAPRDPVEPHLYRYTTILDLRRVLEPAYSEYTREALRLMARTGWPHG